MARNKPLSVIDELGVENGRAIADVVAIYKFTHCYEIKSDLDSLSRLDRQADFYNRNFSKITLIITEKHLDKSLNKLPDFWGVLIAKKVESRIVFECVRKAGLNKYIKKESLLEGMWREELCTIYEESYGMLPAKSYSRAMITKKISHLPKSFLMKCFVDALSTRLQRKSQSM